MGRARAGSQTMSAPPLLSPLVTTALSYSAPNNSALFAAVFAQVSSGLEAFAREHTERSWAEKRQALAVVQRQAELELDRGRRECHYLNGIIFHEKVTSFAHSVDIGIHAHHSHPPPIPIPNVRL
jgi:hypothetical protein